MNRQTESIFGAIAMVAASTFFLLAMPAIAAGLSLPSPSGYVNDFAGVIDGASLNALSSMVAEIESNSTAEIAVVTVPNLQNATVEDYAVKLFQAWGIGKRGVDNGLLILVAPNEKKWRIEIGYGLEPTITDSRAGDVGRSCFTDSFRALKYGDGLKCAVGNFGSLIAGNGSGNPVGSNGSMDDAVFFLIFVIALFLPAAIVIVVIILALKGKIKPGKGRSGKRGGWGWGGGGGGGFGGGGSGGGGASGGW